ncbi:hypothetical protein K501DRAFT_214202, partial [Backusella circina FSU 941]
MVSSFPEYYVRKVTIEDLKHAEQAAKVFMEAYNSKDEGWTSVSKTVDYYRISKDDVEKSIKRSLEGNLSQFFAFQRISDVEEVVIGTISVEPTYKDKAGNIIPGEGYVGSFSVDPKIQSKGIGGKLMRAAIDQLKQDNYSTCVIW